jgi:hypothetical protein
MTGGKVGRRGRVSAEYVTSSLCSGSADFNHQFRHKASTRYRGHICAMVRYIEASGAF